MCTVPSYHVDEQPEGYILRLGGFQEAASCLTTLSGRPYSRQAVHQLWKRRDLNGFPEMGSYHVNGHVKLYFNMDDITRWYFNRTREVS
jgi:hypothetical protein